MKRGAHLAAGLAALLASPSARAQDAVGLNTHVPGPDLLDLCVNLGVQWIRVDANWFEMNPASGRYAWDTMDRVVDGARTRGLRVFMTLAYTPAWVPKVARTRSDATANNDEPATSAEWTTFVDQAVRRYRPRGVTHYGMWNEPNLDGFWENAAGADPYVDKILVPGSTAVHRACADCVVLGPELAHIGSYDAFLDRVLTRGMASIDVLSHHIYNGWPETGTTIISGDSFLNALEMRRFSFTRISLREVLDAHAFTRPVWITETGYRASPAGNATEEMKQATYARRVLEEQITRAWWSNSFFYEIMDCGVDAPDCPIDGFGIARPTRPLSMGGARSFPRDYRLKPAYGVIQGFLRSHASAFTDHPPDAGVDAGRDVAVMDAVAPPDVPDEIAEVDAVTASDVIEPDASMVDLTVMSDAIARAEVIAQPDVAPGRDVRGADVTADVRIATTTPTGCGCEAAGASRTPIGPWSALALVVFAARRRRAMFQSRLRT